MSFVSNGNKTPAEQRDIFRPNLFYNYIKLRLKNALKNATKFDEKKALIHYCPFSKKHRFFRSYFFCDSWPLCVFSALCNLPRKKIFNNFEKHFSQFSILRFSVKEISSPSLEGDFFVTFDHMKLTRCLIDCGKSLFSVFLAPCIFLKLSFGQRVPSCFHS